jgi:hypothetical protein
LNYITEINRFYDWLETNDIPKSAVALWYALMHVNNKAEWKQSFEVAISTLEFKTKFRRSELYEARNILAQKGRITWRPRGGNLSATYEMVPFCVHNTDAISYTKAYTNPDTIPNTNPTQTGTINKLNYTKKELLVVVGESEKKFSDLKDLFEQDVGLKMKWEQNGFPPEKFFSGLQQWMINNHGAEYPDLSDARRHFLFWIPNFENEKEKKLNGSHKTTYGNKKSAGAYELLDDIKKDFGIK